VKGLNYTDHIEQRTRLKNWMSEQHLPGVLLANPAVITWLTGFALPLHPTTSLYMGGPLLLLVEDEHFTLVIADHQAELAADIATQPNCAVMTYAGYTASGPPMNSAPLVQILSQLVTRLHGSIGVETEWMPALHMDTLRANAPASLTFTRIDGWSEPLRMEKTEAEIAQMQNAFDLTCTAHAAAKALITAGNTEFDVWLATQTAIQRAAGQELPFVTDCTVGRRAHIGGTGTLEVILPTDSFVLDLGTRLDGYWSDTCMTYYAGELSARQETMHQTLLAAHDLAVSLIRPGMIASQIDQELRRFITGHGFPEYGHHTGHGIGTLVHELPRIAATSSDILRSNMVIMIEPGIYFAGETGIRLEHAYRVTPHGSERLTNYRAS